MKYNEALHLCGACLTGSHQVTDLPSQGQGAAVTSVKQLKRLLRDSRRVSVSARHHISPQRAARLSINSLDICRAAPRGPIRG